MNKHYKLLAVLSTAAAMSAATPALALSIPGSVSTVLAATAGWLTEYGELRYRDSEGYYLTDSWKKKDGEWYYLNEDGYISRSCMIDEYYVNEEGRRVINQWISEANEDEWDSDTTTEKTEKAWSPNGRRLTEKTTILMKRATCRPACWS